VVEGTLEQAEKDEPKPGQIFEIEHHTSDSAILFFVRLISPAL
jgi:hypothetical protein